MVATVLKDRFNQQGDLLDLTEAIAYSREGLSLVSPSDWHSRHDSLRRLGAYLKARFFITRDAEDVVEFLECFRGMVQLCPPDLPALKSLSLLHLGVVLLDSLEVGFTYSYLRQAVECLKEALSLCPPNDENRRFILINLGNSLSHAEDNQIDDLCEQPSIVYYRQALDIVPAPTPSVR